jgi:poly(3-hydroxybutyrate) depolymerase
LAKIAHTILKLAFCISIFSISLWGNDFTFTVESSNDLNEWETIHTSTVTSEAENTFYRALIEPINASTSVLGNTTLTVTQTWSQETNYSRTAHVQVPDSNAESYPVIIFLHGAGGSGNNMINQYNDHFNSFIKVGMDGYQNKWNIKTEPTKADDISFLKAIIEQLNSYSNVDTQRISLLGSSNGAGLVLKALIELPEDTFSHGIHMATQLTDDHFRENKFWYNEYPSEAYSNETALPSRNKIISFHGTNDSVIPYDGGPVAWLNRTFYDAHDSIFYFAQALGYQGSILSGNGQDTINPDIKKYSYLNQSAIHYKVINGDHGLSGYKNDIVSIILSHIE